MKNPANAVYRCTWAKKGRAYVLQLVDVPGFSARSVKFENARDELNDLVAERLGGYEAFLEFSPPPPLLTPRRNLFEPAWFELGYHDLVEGIPQQSALYTRGYCKQCGSGKGNRTEVSRIIVSPPKGDIAGVKGHLRAIYSDRILNVLGEKAVDTLFRKIPVIFQNPKKPTVYFELVPKKFISLVSARDAEDSSSWLCSKCNTWVFSHRHVEIPGPPISMVSRFDISNWKGHFLPLNCGKKDSIGCNKKMLSKLQADKDLKKLVSKRIAIIDDKDVVREPTLPLYE